MFCRKLPAAGKPGNFWNLWMMRICVNCLWARGVHGGGPRFFEAPGSSRIYDRTAAGKRNPKCLPGGRACRASPAAGVCMTRSGKVKGVEPAMSAMKYFPKVMTGSALGNPEKQPCIYQFATSFPAGLSLASPGICLLRKQWGKQWEKRWRLME